MALTANLRWSIFYTMQRLDNRFPYDAERYWPLPVAEGPFY